MSVMRQIGMILVASACLAVAGTSLATAGVDCMDFPSWCPSVLTHTHDQTGTSGDHSTPAPGAFGLLALGAGVGILRMRRRKNKD